MVTKESDDRFNTSKAAVKWLSDNLGAYWEENCEAGRYAATMPPKDANDDPLFVYANTVIGVVSKLYDAVQG